MWKNVYTIVFSLLLTQQRVSFFLPHSQQDTLQILKVSSVVLRIKAQESGCLGSNSVFTLANYVTLSALLNLPKPSFADLKLGIIVESTSQSYVKIKWKKAIEKEKTKHNTPLHGIWHIQVLKNVSCYYFNYANYCCYAAGGWLRLPSFPKHHLSTRPLWYGIYVSHSIEIVLNFTSNFPSLKPMTISQFLPFRTFH